MVPADSRKISHVPRYSGYHHLISSICTGLSPPMVELSRTIPNQIKLDYVVLQPRNSRNCLGLGLSLFARHYLGNHYCFLFLQVLRCFSSLRLPPFGYSLRSGLPHSEIFGSWTACVYPKLIAACHVLHRLQMPRHPPYTLLFFLPTRVIDPP